MRDIVVKTARALFPKHIREKFYRPYNFVTNFIPNARQKRFERKQFKKTQHFLKKDVYQHALSFVLSQFDDSYSPNGRLVDLAIEAVKRASEIDLKELVDLCPSDLDKKLVNNWPGEHYKLLAALVDVLKPKMAIEIGTFYGTGCLSMKKFLPADGQIITYDITPWYEFKSPVLSDSDFDTRLEQRIMDLTDPVAAESQIEVFKKADFIFVDAAKDGVMEKLFCDFFDSIEFDKKPIVMFDDIRYIPMISIWRNIKHPKLDITSFGHWSGTGLVEWGQISSRPYRISIGIGYK